MIIGDDFPGAWERLSVLAEAVLASFWVVRISEAAFRTFGGNVHLSDIDGLTDGGAVCFFEGTPNPPPGSLNFGTLRFLFLG